jgi:hypothetical protein
MLPCTASIAAPARLATDLPPASPTKLK